MVCQAKSSQTHVKICSVANCSLRLVQYAFCFHTHDWHTLQIFRNAVLCMLRCFMGLILLQQSSHMAIIWSRLDILEKLLMLWKGGQFNAADRVDRSRMRPWKSTVGWLCRKWLSKRTPIFVYVRKLSQRVTAARLVNLQVWLRIISCRIVGSEWEHGPRCAAAGHTAKRWEIGRQIISVMHLAWQIWWCCMPLTMYCMDQYVWWMPVIENEGLDNIDLLWNIFA